jgi:hypothetical protein
VPGNSDHRINHQVTTAGQAKYARQNDQEEYLYAMLLQLVTKKLRSELAPVFDAWAGLLAVRWVNREKDGTRWLFHTAKFSFCH